MALLSDWGFFVKPGMEDEFLEWLSSNEHRLADLAPPTYEYLGTYAPVWRAVGESAPFHQLWRYGRSQPPDLRVAARDTSGVFTEVAKEFLAFVDETRGEEEGFRLYRSLTDPRPEAKEEAAGQSGGS